MSVKGKIVSFLIVLIFCGLILGSEKPCQGETRLLYPQEQALKSIGHRLSKLIREFKIYNKLHEKGTYTKPPKPGLGIMKPLDELYAEFEKNKFPPENQKVKNVKSWFDALKKNTPILEEYYLKGYAEFQKEVKKADMANFPDYNKDIERLKAMYKKYKSPRMVFSNPEKAKELVPQFNDEYAFFRNLPQKYAILLQAKKAGKLETWLRTNSTYMKPFKKYRDEYVKKLPGMIQDELGNAERMAQEAKTNKKPAFFKGGVKQHMEKASSLLSLFEAIQGDENAQVKNMIETYERKKKNIDAIEMTMASELLASVQTPEDNYRGSDKTELIKMVQKEWHKLYPKDDILGIRCHMKNWKRTTNWKWNNSGWYKVDTSVLAVKVIVKTNNQIATIYPAFINKDHMQGDQLSVGAHTKTHAYVVTRMLLKNVKL